MVACAGVLASCGGGDDTDGVEDLLDQAFSGQIDSADLRLEAEIELNGLLKDPITIDAEGPFRTNPGKLPSTDIELRVGSGGGGQTITSGVLSTGDRVFVKFQDVYYEQPAAQVRATNRTLRRAGGRDAKTLSELGLDPRSWLAEAEDKGDADIGGVATEHISGTLDVVRLMRNLNKFVSRSSSALGGDDDAVPRLTRGDIEELAAAVEDPSFEVYVGKRDNLIRRVAGRIDFDVPEASRADLGGLKGGSIKFSVELHDVNGDQEIEAPRRSRPLSRLTDALGGAIEALGAGGATPQEPGPEEGGSDEPSDADELQSYEDCLDKARPEDTEQLQSCAELLQRP
jgi:hypothetical protein